MRLTHIQHLRLPFGPLLSYDQQVSTAGDRLPVSFDQGRHVGEGHRPGSWMALSFRLPHPVPREHLAAAWEHVVARHGTLRTVFSPAPATDNTGAGAALHRVQVESGGWREHRIQPGESMQAAVQRVLDAGCAPFEQPSHRLCVIETADGPSLVIGSDHSHVDMWSMLVMVRDMMAALEQIRAGAGPGGEPAPDFTDHTRVLERSAPAPDEIRRRWERLIEDGGGVMPCFPLPLGEPHPSPERVQVRDVLDPHGLARFSARAKTAGVSTLALSVSMMTLTTAALAGTSLRVVFPVHSRTEPRWFDSVGWFITNSVLEAADPDPQACAAAVREAINLGSWPLAPLLEPWGGMPQGPGMFAVSWLDLRRLPVQIPAEVQEPAYVSAAIRTDSVMLWFILDEAGMHLRCRYPDTDQARQHVGAWLDDLVERMRSQTVS
ncbi:condensation domain-containing protein [Glutamicibacter sp. NPDC087344]|uniref:condensation domain-containing protein n=1 Tax=Glutamicibacter sp. NPDC087344 TaxID=3363994 RepID=UPI0037F76C11